MTPGYSSKVVQPVSQTCLGKCVALIVVLFSVSLSTHANMLKTGKDEQARLPYWEVSNQYMSLRLVQRLPDQSRGYFQARGFTPDQSEFIARACVFQAVFKNNSHTTKPSPLQYDLKKWEVISGGKNTKPKTREDWKPFWQKQNASEPAKIAFEWSLLPTVQEYQPGDFNWGMTAFGLKPGTPFDLQISWQQHGKQHKFQIKNMQCAADIHPDPEEFRRDE